MIVSSHYMPQLDGLRAFAVTSVLMFHFLPKDSFINRLLHLGRLGVVLFFVLSGFLITGILLQYRDDSLLTHSSKWRYFRIFYARRMLRIFPIYYVTLLIAVFAQYPPVKDYWLWHAAYVSNIATGFFGITFGAAGHLWSLCVEEQFYLFWPLVIMFSPRRAVPWLVVSLIAGSVAYKLVGGWLGLDWLATHFTTLGCLDSLAVGAALAILKHEHPHAFLSSHRFVTSSLRIGLPLLIALQLFRFSQGIDVREHFLYQGLIDLAASLSFAGLIAAGSDGLAWSLSRALEWGPIRYVGKISYGIYLYHFFIQSVVPYWVAEAGLWLPSRGYAVFILYFLVSITVAAVSWHIFERPINNLKSYFSPLYTYGSDQSITKFRAGRRLKAGPMS